jgi:two-component system, NtrC family, sensor kinase
MRRQDSAAGKKGRTIRRLPLKTASKAKVARASKGTRDGAVTIALLERQLNDALEQQTAASEVLNVISSSPRDIKPVFEAILSNALRICEAKFGHLLLYEGESFQATHLHDVPPSYREYWEQHGPIHPSPNTGLGRLARTKQVAHIPDLKADSAYIEREPLRVVTVEQAGARSFLAVPMLKENRLIGAIVIYRKEVRPFTDKQIELVRNFAAQAVIAIENARLFSEVQARTRDLEEALRYQIGSANILKVIASSPTDVGPVLTAIVESACELCQAYDALVRLRNGDSLDYSAHHGPIPVSQLSLPINRQWTAGLAVIEQRPVHVADLLSSEGDPFPDAHDRARRFGHRTILSVPLLREGESIGAIILRRTEVNPFSDKQIALLQTFADQAVIAIGNVRLFEEVQARTKELAKSLDDLRTAQDRLVQTEKLASLGQLTAGIAHEIKNPLNFVNNFAALSAELGDELKDALRPAVLDDTLRTEVNELTGLLKDNLGKVVQHGKRADSIVKNMLLHSREGSGEQRSADINALVEESLNLAYHGARAEKPGFNITMRRNIDPDAGMIDVYPQEITRVLLNLISNGFYAATKRKESDEDGFEPTLTASTRSLANGVEIRIRDNGNGIPEEIKVKIFNPFFTTKPAGEGTGLGLSMSHDIIVKQHGGSIHFETELGVFTEFVVTLPRATSAQKPERSAD